MWTLDSSNGVACCSTVEVSLHSIFVVQTYYRSNFFRYAILRYGVIRHRVGFHIFGTEHTLQRSYCGNNNLGGKAKRLTAVKPHWHSSTQFHLTYRQFTTLNRDHGIPGLAPGLSGTPRFQTWAFVTPLV